MKTQISTLSKQEKNSTFAATIKSYSKDLMQAMKELQAAEEDDMTAKKTGTKWMADDAKTNISWALSDVMLYAQMIIDEARNAQEAYKVIEQTA